MHEGGQTQGRAANHALARGAMRGFKCETAGSLAVWMVNPRAVVTSRDGWMEEVGRTAGATLTAQNTY